jgi:ABC-type glycerol-3-phosphate transport system permease component
MPSRIRKPLAAAGLNALIAAIAVLILVPFAWVVVSSFKPRGDVFSSVSIWWPRHFTLENYSEVFLKTPLLTYIANSVVATLFAMLLNIPLGGLAAYAFSRLRFKGAGILMASVLVTQFLPGASLLVPLFKQWSALHVLNSPFTLGFTYAGLTIPLVLLLMYGFFNSIPRELDESAEMDGLTQGQTLRYIMFPLARPGVVAAAIFSFNTTWQEFMLASCFSNKSSAFTLPVGMYSFMGNYVTNWGGILAMAVILALPLCVLFTLFQDQFVYTLSGSIKG